MHSGSEEKFFREDDNMVNNDLNNEDLLLEKFGNQWLIKTQKFDFGNNKGQAPLQISHSSKITVRAPDPFCPFVIISAVRC